MHIHAMYLNHAQTYNVYTKLLYTDCIVVYKYIICIYCMHNVHVQVHTHTAAIVTICYGSHSSSEASHHTHHVSILPVPAQGTHGTPRSVMEHFHTTFVLTARSTRVGVHQTNIDIILS